MNLNFLDELSKYDLIELAWAAGIIEGEGTFVPQPRITVAMVDEDIIVKLKSIFKCGHITTRLLPSGKTLFSWSISNKKDFKEVCMLILPFMGIRRTERINSILV